MRGLSRGDLRAIDRAALSRDRWTALLRVAVAADGRPADIPVAGSYAVDSGTLRFTPIVPFEPGRSYVVVLDPAAAPGGALAGAQRLTHTVAAPPAPRSDPVRVTGVYPAGPQVPANLLRMYVEFSGPMGTRPGQDYVRLVDGEGRDIPDALLPLDTGLWNGDRTRFTILFDPGRVKRGILPNRTMGRPLRPGGTFSILVARDWPDAHGQPLTAAFEKTYRVGAAREQALSTRVWRVSAPAADTREPLHVAFPFPLDRGLLQRALTVIRIDPGGDGTVAGSVAVDPGETAWRFVPSTAWRAGDYAVSVLPALEDPSGNRIGQAFETRNTDDVEGPPARVLFSIR
ncbi:MAG TPA: hypothetical protein VFK57_07580 [Vicinamibacterales bacterium]|nr:hypothetical protein [Vicinamibacterales bacterium]